MSLNVTVKSASNLPNVERWFSKKSDPLTICTLRGNQALPHFCCKPEFYFSGKEKETKVIDNNLEPVWDEVRQRQSVTS